MEIERKFLIPDVYVKELFERDAERLEIEQYYVTVGTTSRSAPASANAVICSV